MTNWMKKTLATATCLATLATAHGAVLVADSAGKLAGAKGVTVNMALYDVAFVDGSCASVFNGCDRVSDFQFQSIGMAQSAAIALLDQVFLDGPLGAFDAHPELIVGCVDASMCWGVTPFGLDFAPNSPLISAYTISAVNHGLATGVYDEIRPLGELFLNSANLGDYKVWAVWSEADSGTHDAPEPGSLTLAALAIAGAWGATRRR